MRHWRCLLGHKWFVGPHRGSMWRGCDRCGKQQMQTVFGRWKDWDGQSQD